VAAKEVGDKVADVGIKVEGVDIKVEDIGDKVEDIGDQVQCVDEKVRVVIDGARGLCSQLSNHSNIYTFRRQASKSHDPGNKIDRSTDGQRHGPNQVFVTPY
jgi:hypothetical protein